MTPDDARDASPPDDVHRITIVGCRVLSLPRFVRGEGSDAPMDIRIVGNLIESVEPAGTQPVRGAAIDGRGLLATPGWINGHTHSHEGFHRGRYDNVPLELWMNNVRPLEPIPYSPRQVYLRTLIGALDAVRSGTTTICDDMNASPRLQPELVEAALRAYDDLGIRALSGITLFDKPFFRAMPFVDEEFDPALLAGLGSVKVTPATEYLQFVEELARTRHPRQHRVGCLLAPSAPQRCTPEFLMRVRGIADEHRLPVITHVHETRLQAVTAQELYGCSMVEYLHRLDFLKPATSLIHGVWLTPRDIELLADSGASVQHNPQSNLKLGSGIAPLRALLDAGVNVSLGTDGCGSIDNADMLKVMHGTALLHKLRGLDYQRWIGADEAFAAATTGGAQALGMADMLGRIEPGLRADLCLWNLSSPGFRPLNDPLRQLVFNETGRGLHTSIVDGRIVLADGVLTGIDEGAILDEIQEEWQALHPLIADRERKVSQLFPSYKRIWDRCCATPIDSRIFPARLDD
jgi:guanine deaminase